MESQRKGCAACPTRRFCLGAGLGLPALEALTECVREGAPLHRGEPLYRPGERANSLFFVRSGSFKTEVTSSDGTGYVAGFHFPGDVIGTSGLEGGRFRDSATALETATACRLPVEALPRIWDIGSGNSLMRLLGSREHRDTRTHSNLSQPAADARVAGFLVSLAGRMRRLGLCDDSLPLAMSRTDLANHLGMTLECLSRVLSRMTRDGLISTSRHSITAHQPKRLARLAGHLDA